MVILVPCTHSVKTTDSEGVVRLHQCVFLHTSECPSAMLRYNAGTSISREGLCLSWFTPTAFVQCGGWESFQEIGGLSPNIAFITSSGETLSDLTSLYFSFLICRNDKSTHLLELLWWLSELIPEKYLEQCWVSGTWLKNISYLLSFKTQFKCTWRFPELDPFLGSFSTLVMPLVQHLPCSIIITNSPILSLACDYSSTMYCSPCSWQCLMCKID